MIVKTPAQVLMVQEAREALRQHAAGNVAGYELHRANTHRIRDAVAEWERSGDLWHGRYKPAALTTHGAQRECCTCGLPVSDNIMALRAHQVQCDKEQRRIADLQQWELQQLRIRGHI